MKCGGIRVWRVARMGLAGAGSAGRCENRLSEMDCSALSAGLLGFTIGFAIGITLIVFGAENIVAWPARRMTLFGVAVTI